MNQCVFSEDRVFRYSLLHQIDELIVRDRGDSIIAWIGLNPSTADETKLDPTLRRVRFFTIANTGNTFVMLNLYAFKATDPKQMIAAHKSGRDIIGPENDRLIMEWASRAAIVVGCWGAGGDIIPGRVDAVRRLIHKPMKCLGRTKGFHPRHPLYLPNDRALEIL